jgi:hypothetical protein
MRNGCLEGGGGGACRSNSHEVYNFGYGLIILLSLSLIVHRAMRAYGGV